MTAIIPSGGCKGGRHARASSTSARDARARSPLDAGPARGALRRGGPLHEPSRRNAARASLWRVVRRDRHGPPRWRPNRRGPARRSLEHPSLTLAETGERGLHAVRGTDVAAPPAHNSGPALLCLTHAPRLRLLHLHAEEATEATGALHDADEVRAPLAQAVLDPRAARHLRQADRVVPHETSTRGQRAPDLLLQCGLADDRGHLRDEHTLAVHDTRQQ